MKQMIVLLSSLLITLMCSVNLNAQWYEKSNGLPINCWAAAIDAYDSLIATGPYTKTSDYIPDSLYVTTNGGNNWYPIPLPDNLQPGDGLVDISIIGEDKIWFCTDLGKIYRTTDGGINWQRQFYDTLMTKFMNYVEMFDSLNGMAMGDAPAIDKPTLFLKTTNGGTDWISQNESYLIGMWGGDIWRRVDFVDINTGYFFSSGGIGKLYKTINGGKDWQVFNDTIFCNVLKGFDENIFLCEEATASLAGIVHRTIDGGQNWESEQFDFLDWGYDIEFTAGNSSNVWCASAPLSFSSDTGRTWVKEFNAPNGLFLDIVFTDENNGWLFEGVSRELINIYRTTNGGIGGIVSVDNEIDFSPDGFRLEQNYPNPFNPTTIIRYLIPEISFVTIKVYDVLGNEISRMVNEEKPAGEYGVEFGGDGLTSGIYFYRLQAGDYTNTKKMILLR